MRKLLPLLFLLVPGGLFAQGREVENLAAFARLLGAVRLFHPSDAVAAADWNRVAVAGIDAVEGAEDPAALARALEGFFRPLAPTLRIYPRGERPETPPDLLPPEDGREVRIAAWRHYGGAFSSPSKVFSSERIDDRTPPGLGLLAQAVDAAPLRGRRVRLRALVRTEEGGSARLGLRVLRPGGEPGFTDEMEDRPIRDRAWRSYEIEGDVAPDALRIVVALILTGGGKAFLDEVSLEPVEGGKTVPFANAGFDEGEEGTHPPGWLFPYETIRAGYHLSLRRGGLCRRGGCAEVAGDAIAAPRFVRPDEVLEIDLGAGVAAALPVTLYAEARGTLPRADPAGPWASVDIAADTRSARLAAVATLWGLLQHLHPELDVESAEWQNALPEALAGAAAAPDRAAFANVLRKLLVPLRDDKANFLFHRSDPEPRVLPIAWERVEGSLVITGVGPGAGDLRPGDVVAAIDGRPAADALADVVALTSGATLESRTWLALDFLATGPPGSKVTLRIERSGTAPFDVTPPRTAAYGEVPGTPLAAVAEPRPGVVYVDLGRISEEEFGGLLPRLAAAKGVVFDLRRGSNVSNVVLSHLTDRTIMSSSWQVPVVMRPGRRDIQWLTTFWNVGPRAPRLRKVAVLADARCTGYCETLLAMIEHHRLAAIVGERSGACNGSINRVTLPGGWSAGWTGQRVLKSDGSPLHAAGVAPAVPAARTLRGIAEGRDEAVERAVGVVLR